MLEKPPEEFTKLAIEFSMDKISIDELEALYSPQGIIDNCLGAIEYLVRDWHEAALMLKELVISSKLNLHKIDYSSLIAQSKLLELSQNWLFTEPSRRKNIIIYVMGKLSDKQYLPILNKAFEYYKNTDPFIMERLIFELSWLGDQNHDDKFNCLLNHKNFIFRLTCVEAVQAGADQGDQESIERLKALKNDPHPAVATAARDDAYFFNLACVDCKRDLYDQETDDYDQKEVSVEQFTKWAAEHFS